MKSFKIKYQKNRKVYSKTVQKSSKDDLVDIDNIISFQEIKKDRIKGIGLKFRRKNDISRTIVELDLMLQANITLMDAIEILKNSSNNGSEDIFIEVIYKALKNGKSISNNLKDIEEEIGVLPHVFFKLGEENGNINSAVNALSKTLNSINESKAKIKNALRYPLVLILALMSALGIIFNLVVPKFEYLFKSFGTGLPVMTDSLLIFKDIFSSYLIPILLILLLIIIFLKYKYQNSSSFKLKFDTFLVKKVPILKNILIEIELYMFFLSISFLLKEKYQFQSAFKNSKVAIQNQFISKKFDMIEDSINSGSSIYEAFKSAEIVDELTLRLLNSGEISNSLYRSTEEIRKVYQLGLNNKINIFTVFIEPVVLAVIAVFILWLVLAIFVPIWDMGTIIK